MLKMLIPKYLKISIHKYLYYVCIQDVSESVVIVYESYRGGHLEQEM
jgi:hypothetical protein